MPFQAFAGLTKVYNSGGWVVDAVERQKFHGGAVILIDENHEAVSLRMYTETWDPGGTPVSVEEAAYRGDPPGAFQQRIAGLVAKTPDLWKDFSQAVARDIHVRAENLRTRINAPLGP